MASSFSSQERYGSRSRCLSLANASAGASKAVLPVLICSGYSVAKHSLYSVAAFPRQHISRLNDFDIGHLSDLFNEQELRCRTPSPLRFSWDIKVEEKIAPSSPSSSRVRDSAFHRRGSRIRLEQVLSHQGVLLRFPLILAACHGSPERVQFYAVTDCASRVKISTASVSVHINLG